MIRVKLAASAVAIAIVAGSAAAYAKVDDVRPVTPVLARCNDPELIATSQRDLITAINAAVRALPADRSTAEDIEAAIIYAISQRQLCPGVARGALNSLAYSGNPAFKQAVAQVRNSLLPDQFGTAGLIGTGNGSNSNGFFSSPIIGIGGGSANYSQ